VAVALEEDTLLLAEMVVMEVGQVLEILLLLGIGVVLVVALVEQH